MTTPAPNNLGDVVSVSAIESRRVAPGVARDNDATRDGIDSLSPRKSVTRAGADAAPT